MLKWYFAVGLHFLVVAFGSAALAADSAPFPRFRHVDKVAPALKVSLPASLTLLADEDFAPFSFKTADGKLSGLSIQLALAVCAELRVKCEVKGMAYGGLAAALSQKQGDVIISGSQGAANAAATRPYFYSYSGFFARLGFDLPSSEPSALAGRRIGYVKGTAQEAFLKVAYARAALVPFAAEEPMFDALRTGGLDVAFADRMHGIFWIRGSSSRACCQAFGGGYVDKATFTRGLVMLTRPQDEGLRDAFDFALDRLEDKGQAGKIFATFIPESPF